MRSKRYELAMRTLRRSSRGLSEIVGTLMLVLIVVGAATSLSIFITEYQKQVQAEEGYTHDQQLEKLRITEVTPTLMTGSMTNFGSMTFNLASESSESSIVTAIYVNNNPVEQYLVAEVSPNASYTWIPIAAGGQLDLSAHEVVDILLYFNPMTPSNSSFYDTSFDLLTADYVTIQAETAYLNTFQLSLVPPTAIAEVTTLTTYTGTGYLTVPVLDGSQSVVPDANDTIVQWNWVLTDNTAMTTQMFSGEKWALEGSYTYVATDSYSATLTVLSSDGLSGSTTISFV